jgi:hypothetical protein
VKSSFCLFLINYLKSSLKLIFELLIVTEYEFLIVHFFSVLSRNSCSLRLTQSNAASLRYYSKQAFVHLELNFAWLNSIYNKLDQEGSQLLSLTCECIECQYLKYIDRLLKALKVDLTCQSWLLCTDCHSYIVRMFKVLRPDLRCLKY